MPKVRRRATSRAICALGASAVIVVSGIADIGLLTAKGSGFYRRWGWDASLAYALSFPRKQGYIWPLHVNMDSRFRGNEGLASGHTSVFLVYRQESQGPRPPRASRWILALRACDATSKTESASWLANPNCHRERIAAISFLNGCQIKVEIASSQNALLAMTILVM